MVFNISTGMDDDGNAAGSPPQPQKPLQRAQQTKQARQAGPEPDRQPEAEPGPQNEPPAQKPNGEGELKRQFAVVCDTVAMDHNVIAANGKLVASEYKDLLSQAMQLSGEDTIAGATQWAIENVKAMVKDDAGIRFIA
jgi:hypothetical protein